MSRPLPDRLEAGRTLTGPWASEPGQPWGLFDVMGPRGCALRIVASLGPLAEKAGWEHVSVSNRHRCPNWPEMCWVKDLFWDPELLVIQLHVPRSLWVDNHPYCLHLWRPTQFEVPLPPAIMVGVQGMSYEAARRLAAEMRRST